MVEFVGMKERFVFILLDWLHIVRAKQNFNKKQ